MSMNMIAGQGVHAADEDFEGEDVAHNHDGDGDEDGVKVLPVVPSIIVPDDADPVYKEIWRQLGQPNVNVLEICGGTLEGMLNMLQQIYDHVVDPAGMETRSMWQSYERACGLFSVAPNSMVSPARIKQLYTHAILRLIVLHTAISERLRMQHITLEHSEVANLMKERGEVGQDDVTMEARSHFLSILKTLDTASTLLKCMVENHATQTLNTAITTRFPPVAFNLMDDTTTRITPSQSVERDLLWKLFKAGARRMGKQVMQPHYVTKQGIAFNTHAYVGVGSILEWVERETSLTTNFDTWTKRGSTKVIAYSLEMAETYLFPPLRVIQGVYACQDAVLNFREMWFYFYDQDDPMVEMLVNARDAALHKIELCEARHQALLQLEEENAAMLVQAMNDLQAVAASGDNDEDQEAQREDIIRRVNQRQVELQQRQEQAKAELEKQAQCNLGQEEEEEEDGDIDMTGEIDMTAESVNGGDEEGENNEEGSGNNRNNNIRDGGDVSMAPVGDEAGDAMPPPLDALPVQEDDLGDESLLAQDIIAEHKACIQRMRAVVKMLKGLFREDPPPPSTVAEMFIDLPFPWQDMQLFLQPVKRIQSIPVPSAGDAGDGGGPEEHMTLTSGWLELDYRRIRTPKWQYLFEYQQLPADAVDFAAYVMLGRMIFPPKLLEQWQVMYEEIGWSGTGKSLKAAVMESVHRETHRLTTMDEDGEVEGDPAHQQTMCVNRTGILASNIEVKFGPSEVLGIKPEDRKFAVICREMTAELAKNFPESQMLVWAANEENTWPVKNEAPLVACAPHTALFGNHPLPHKDTNDNMNRRRITVRNNVQVKQSNPNLEMTIKSVERLPLLIKAAIAYTSKAMSVVGRGIWNAGVLPQYFHTQRKLNRMANQPLVAFIHTCNRELIMLDETANEDAAAGAAPSRGFMSMKRLQSLVNDFITRSRNGMRRVDWTNAAAIAHTLESFGCRVVVPSRCDPSDLPPGLRPTSRGRWILGLTELSAPDEEESGNNHTNTAVSAGAVQSTGGAGASLMRGRG